MNAPAFWTTHEEIKFLERIGSYGLYQKNRKEILRKYLDCMKVRSRWDKIDRDQIIDYIVNELRR